MGGNWREDGSEVMRADVLVEGLGLMPCTYMAAHKNSSSKGPKDLTLEVSHAHVVYILTNAHT